MLRIMGASRTLVIRVWGGARPMFEPVRPEAGHWVFGRETIEGDTAVARRHCELRQRAGKWEFTLLDAGAATAIDGVRAEASAPRKAWRVLRVGRSLFVPLTLDADTPLRMTHRGGEIVGPGLHRTCEAVRAEAAAGRHLVFVGEPGCGFAILALQVQRALGVEGRVHALRIDRGEDVPLPHRGVVLVIGGGTLARIVEHPWVRAAFERPELRVCVGLRRRNRSEAYELPQGFESKLARVDVPDLDVRAEEIPWWIRRALRDVQPTVSVDVSLVEACLLRAWARGIDGLVDEVRAAADRARRAGRAEVLGTDLADALSAA